MLQQTKLYLYDHTNSGILVVFNPSNRSKIEATLLRYCILDTNTGMAVASCPVFNLLDNFQITKNFLQRNPTPKFGGAVKGNQTEINEMFLRKRELAQMMYPVISLLVEGIFKRSYNALNDFGTSMDDVLAHEVQNSNPDADQYSPGVREFAKTLGISNLAAYEEMKLEYETAYAIKIRSYAYMRMFQTKIRAIQTQADADALYNEVRQKLLVEPMI